MTEDEKQTHLVQFRNMYVALLTKHIEDKGRYLPEPITDMDLYIEQRLSKVMRWINRTDMRIDDKVLQRTCKTLNLPKSVKAVRVYLGLDKSII